jgi:hypothetical protein
MDRIGVSFISRLFAVFALILCFYSFFISPETAVKTQAIYWFCAALLAACIPNLKDVVGYVESIKLGDVEIALNEVRREIERVDTKVEKVDSKVD